MSTFALRTADAGDAGAIAALHTDALMDDLVRALISVWKHLELEIAA